MTFLSTTSLILSVMDSNGSQPLHALLTEAMARCIEQNQLQPSFQNKISKIKLISRANHNPFCLDIGQLHLVIADNFKLTELGVKAEIKLLNRDSATSVQFIKYKVRAVVLGDKNASLRQKSQDVPTVTLFAAHYNPNSEPVITGRRFYLANKVDVHFKVHQNETMAA